MLAFSIPTIRSKCHNLWEQMYRFAGWLLLMSSWAFFIMYNIFQSRSKHHTPLDELLHLNPAFYLVSLTTTSIVLSWIRLLRVHPRAERLSNHAIRLQDTPFLHPPADVFASMSDSYTKGYSVLISRADNWTSEVIGNPPQTLWTRGKPAGGVFVYGGILDSSLRWHRIGFITHIGLVNTSGPES